MPQWTDETGFSWFDILECKRCLSQFEIDETGEIPAHDCIGGTYKSVSENGECHMPKKCDRPNPNKKNKQNKI